MFPPSAVLITEIELTPWCEIPAAVYEYSVARVASLLLKSKFSVYSVPWPSIIRNIACFFRLLFKRPRSGAIIRGYSKQESLCTSNHHRSARVQDGVHWNEILVP